ncbi:hypothetical protein ACFQZJ_14975 [Maribacter chungangensis]|uniref:Tetratricopeptide repeat protein n=1 Tax=Maribacter chungangensis TaxID=1069117 RepID=A0ABW3B626_9FLAO
MKVTDFTYLLTHPSKVADPVRTNQLEDILKEYPYFQAARALHLKGLKNLHSYKYNKALKTTAAYTTDRDVLFDFITTKDFLEYTPRTVTPAVKETVPKQKAPLAEKKPIIEPSEDKPLPQDQKDAEQILNPELFTSKPPRSEASATLAMGEPLEFNKKEKFSFTEWLQLTTKKSMGQEEGTLEQEEIQDTDLKEQRPSQKQKFDRIDKFIAQNPKIVPKTNIPVPENLASSGVFDKKELMTETLARVYLEQKKYKKAIQAYKILSLKYPEKSGFFADRLKMVEKIQLENRDLQ